METERRIDKKRTHLMLMGAILALTIAMLAMVYWPFERPHEGQGALELRTGWWVFTEDAPEPVEIPFLDAYIPVEAGRKLTMVRTMTERAQNAAILIHLDYLNARVFIGGKLLFSNEDDPPGANKGLSDRLIVLPEAYLGQELRVEVNSPYPLYSFSPDVMLFGNAKALMASALARDARNVALMFMLALSGLALMGFSLSRFWMRREYTAAPWAGMLFGLFCVLFGVSFPGNGVAFLMAFAPKTAAWLVLSAWHVAMTPMLWFLWMKCEHTKRLALLLAVLYSACALGMAFWSGIGLCAPPDTLPLMNSALIIAVLWMFALGIYEWIRGNRFFRMTSPASLVLGAAGVLSVIDIQGFYTPKELLRIAGLLLLCGLVWADILRASARTRRADDEERQLLRLRGMLAAEQFAASEAHSKETRMLHHEIRHHLMALTVLQQEGNLQGIGAYLENLDVMKSVQEDAQYCEHTLVNAILAKAGRDCEREAIEFTCEACVPRGIPIPDADLSTLLLNVLENAVEAARQVDGAKRWIDAQVRVKDEYLVVSCGNARQGEIEQQGDRFVSTKPNTRLHGYGIMAARQVAHKYESKLNIDYDDTSFSVKTILKITKT